MSAEFKSFSVVDEEPLGTCPGEIERREMAVLFRGTSTLIFITTAPACPSHSERLSWRSLTTNAGEDAGKANKENHSELHRFRVKLDLQRSQEVPRGGKMAAQAGNVFYTRFTFPWEPEFGQGLRQLINNSSASNQHKATLGFIPVHLSLLALLKPILCST